jgi:hypothetical protein
MIVNIFLDDLRDPSFIGADETWLIPRTADACITLLEKHAGQVETLSLDHDLADAHYEGKFSNEKTGYDVALWLEEQAFNGNFAVIPRWMLCHSMNPVGKARILKCLDNVKRIRDSNS